MSVKCWLVFGGKSFTHRDRSEKEIEFEYRA